MKKILILLCLLGMVVSSGFAQKNKPVTPAPRPAAPKGPPPYVLKKDYEPQMEELKSKVSAAASAANAARNSIDGKFAKVIVLDSQMQEVQAILSSASFQIAMNADSLKETRFSMEEFQKKTEANFSTAQEQQAAFSQTVWMLFGVAMALSVVVLVVLLSVVKKRMTALESVLHKNEEILKKSLSLSTEKMQQELKDSLQSSESRMLVDISALKRELSNQLNQQKEATSASIQQLENKIADMENPPSDTPANNDPEIFI